MSWRNFMASGYVYIIDPHIEIDDRPVVKIGMTTRSPHKRLKELQTSLPHKAALIRAVQFPDAKAAERSLHRSLDACRVRRDGGGEFFFLDPSEAVQIVTKLAYQVSAGEAKTALDRELQRFSEQVSGGLTWKITKWNIITMFLGVFFYFVHVHEVSRRDSLLCLAQRSVESGFLSGWRPNSLETRS